MGQWCREAFIFLHTSEKSAYWGITLLSDKFLSRFSWQHKHTNDYGSHITQTVTCLWQTTEINQAPQLNTNTFPLFLWDGYTKRIWRRYRLQLLLFPFIPSSNLFQSIQTEYDFRRSNPISHFRLRVYFSPLFPYSNLSSITSLHQSFVDVLIFYYKCHQPLMSENLNHNNKYLFVDMVVKSRG